MDTPNILDELGKPLDPKRVAKRDGAGSMKLSYLETYDVIDTLNRIFGYDGWSDRVLELAPVNENLWRATVELSAWIGERLVTHSDTGIGVSRGGKSEETEKCVKEAVSDGLKRAARKFGDQFGNCLYDKHAPEHGGTQQRPLSTQQRPAHQAQPQRQSTPVSGDVPNCPDCGGGMFDNRLTKRSEKAPDFKCKDKSCDKAIWLNSKSTQAAPAQAAQQPAQQPAAPEYTNYGELTGVDIEWLVTERDWLLENQPLHPQLDAMTTEIELQQAASREALPV